MRGQRGAESAVLGSFKRVQRARKVDGLAIDERRFENVDRVSDANPAKVVTINEHAKIHIERPFVAERYESAASVCMGVDFRRDQINYAAVIDEIDATLVIIDVAEFVKQKANVHCFIC